MVTPEMIMAVRIEIQDVEPGLYLLPDATIEYFLTKNNESIARATIDAAKSLLFKLSLNSSEDTVDIFTIKGAKAAEAYMLALKMLIKDPTLNPMLNNLQGYVGGVSKQDMLDNDLNPDNNIVKNPSKDYTSYGTVSYFNF